MALIATAAAGCGFGPGESTGGTAELVVTRDHGAERLLDAEVNDPPSSETVARFLDREAEIETGYGGNFVESIEGVTGSDEGGGRRDWFFYVNGYWSPVGAAEARVRPGDRVWWDYRRWDVAYRVGAVVGSWPEPFVHGFEGQRFQTVLDCKGDEAACAVVRQALRSAGAELVAGSASSTERLRVLVGPLARLGEDADAELLEDGPAVSGVYVEAAADGSSLELLDEEAEPVRELGSGSGLVAAVRRGEGQPTWIVTGIGTNGVRAAAAALERRFLEDAYALAIDAADERIRLPVSR